MFFELITTLVLERFIVKLYKLNTENNSLDLSSLESMVSVLNTKEYPRGIIDELSSNPIITQIEIFDTNDNLLIRSSLALIPENIL
jgi:hypothetical protein